MPGEAIALAIKELASLLKKWGGAFFAFIAGRKSKQADIDKAEKKSLETELEAEREEDRILNDADELERMRGRFHKSE